MTVGAFLNDLQRAAQEEATRAEEPAKKVSGRASEDLSWTAGEDFGSSDEVLLRKNCARILHRYLQKVLGEKDQTEGLPSYESVRDLYDCRICAPHISQVLAKGIMETYDRNGLHLFEGNREVEKEEATLYIRRLFRNHYEMKNAELKEGVMSKTGIEQWNQAAGAFAKEQEKSAFSDMNIAIVKKRFTKLSGEKVLDLGCGYGYYTDYFRSIGGEVIGVDGAPEMIGLAKERYPDSAFAVADITEKLPFEDGEFDIVFCNQVLMDIEPVEPVFAECRRMLKPGGIFYYSIVHPAFYTGEWKTDGETGRTGKMVTSYITPSVCENRFWGETKHYHRPLSYYLNGAAEVGLVLVRVEEPKSYGSPEKNEEIPLFFFAEYRK